MKLLSLSQINDLYLSYRDLRSTKKWLSGRGISIIKLGRKYFVNETEFNKMLQSITGIEDIEKPISKKRDLNINEQQIYSDLINKIK